jgi:hypothetical protein
METQDQARRVLAHIDPELHPAVVAGIRKGWKADDFNADELAATLDLTPEVINKLLAGLKPPRSASQASVRPNSGMLNERELEILGLIADGLTMRSLRNSFFRSTRLNGS